MAKTVDVVIYPVFTEKDLIAMLQLRPGEKETTSEGYTFTKNRRDEVEVTVKDDKYEVDA